VTLQKRDESLRFAVVKPLRAVVGALLITLLVPVTVPAFGLSTKVTHAAPAGDDEVIAFVVRGVGNGHGRGMSQWGSYGRAVNGQTWQSILQTYYGGTQPGTRTEANLRVRLTGWDSAGTVGVISRPGTARWAGASANGGNTNYTSLHAEETSPNVFTVRGVTSGFGCPGAVGLTVPTTNLQEGSTGTAVVQLQQVLTHLGFDPQGIDGQFGSYTATALRQFQADAALAVDGRWRVEEWTEAQRRIDAEGGTVAWQVLATGVTGPIRFTTAAKQSTAGSGDVLGVCGPSGLVTHYRGTIELLHTGDGNRVVNQLNVENYLRGVVPRESPASWGGGGGSDPGMNALRAQSVAARSFALSQGRYPYARTCDTASCQVYGGTAIRLGPTAGGFVRREHVNTDEAVADTASVVRVWPGSGAVVSTEFSASNGPRTAGGQFPAVNDPWDDQPGNPNHRWARVIDADAIRGRYGLTTANGVRTTTDADSPYDGIWANQVVLGNGNTVSAWDFRNAYGLPAPGFELIPVRRALTGSGGFAFIGDSVGVGVTDGATSNFRVLTEGVFSSARFDALVNRRTQGGTVGDGVQAASEVALGTDLAVVELGYNDNPPDMPARIDAVMAVLRRRGVDRVAWVTLSERRPEFAATNAAIRAAADRWSEMIVLDWERHSDHRGGARWFADDVHLTATGRAEFSLWLRDQVVALLADGYTPPRQLAPGVPLHVPVAGVSGIAAAAGSGVVGVALNVSAVAADGAGWLRVWPCGADEPVTAAVSYVAGEVATNAVVVPVDDTGEVCVSSRVGTDVVVDLGGWFDAGVRSAQGRLVDTREAKRLRAGRVLRVPAVGVSGMPGSGVVGVALNVSAVAADGAGWLRVWPCGADEPVTAAVSYVAGEVATNAVVVPVDDTGEVCVSSRVGTDVVVDLGGWFDAGVRSAQGRLVDTRYGIGPVPGR
jgi:peptidoglycan hydrolase-like protein with peptidoglycan-binding domain